MSDPILEEIWRVREELLKQHGGLKGYLAYVTKLDRARRRRDRASPGRTARKRKVKDAS